MPKKKDKDAVEYQKSIIRHLKKQLRTQEKKIKHLERTQHLYEGKEIDEQIQEEITPPKPEHHELCSQCRKGYMEYKTVLDRYWYSCSVCPNRTKAKKV